MAPRNRDKKNARLEGSNIKKKVEAKSAIFDCKGV